jgi:hypothetical protein
MLQAQKARPGFSPPNRAAKVAVISGSTPSTTPPWEAGTVCMATLEKAGKAIDQQQAGGQKRQRMLARKPLAEQGQAWPGHQGGDGCASKGDEGR